LFKSIYLLNKASNKVSNKIQTFIQSKSIKTRTQWNTKS